MGESTDKKIGDIRSELLTKHPEHFYVELDNLINADALALSKYPNELIDPIYPEIMRTDIKFGWYLPNFREIFRETYKVRKKEICDFISDAIEASETPVIGTPFNYLLFSQYNQENPGSISSDAFIKIFESEAQNIVAKYICSEIEPALKFNPKTPRDLIALIKQNKNGKWMYDESILRGIITDELFSYITAPPEHRECGPNQSLAAKMYLNNGKLKNPWEDYRNRR